MKRRILHSIVAVTTISVVLFGVPLAIALGRFYRQQRVLVLERQATRAVAELPEDLAHGETELDPPDTIAGTTLGYYDRTGRRVIGHGPKQLPLAEAAAGITKIKGALPVLEAMRGRVVDADIKGFIVTAVPVTEGQDVVGAIRAAEPRSVVASHVHRTWFGMAFLALAIVGLAALVARAQARRLVRPLNAIGDAAGRLGDGDFTSRAPQVGVAEFDAVSSVLNSTAERLGDLVARERSFSSDASHQLRTPLTGLRLRLERSLTRPAEHEAALVDAIDLVDDLCDTVEQLLALARDLPMAREPLDVGDVLDAAAAKVRPELWERRRTVSVVVDAGLPVVRASTVAIHQIVDVLAGNAVVHGGGHVVLRARDTGAGVAIEVSDEGGGVNGDVQRIFERRSEAASGHGIGLALARSLAEAEGARLALQQSGPRPTFVLMLLADDDDTVGEPTAA